MDCVEEERGAEVETSLISPTLYGLFVVSHLSQWKRVFRERPWAILTSQETSKDRGLKILQSGVSGVDMLWITGSFLGAILMYVGTKAIRMVRLYRSSVYGMIAL